MNVPEYLISEWETVHKPRVTAGMIDTIIRVRETTAMVLPLVLYFDTELEELFLGQATVLENEPNRFTVVVNAMQYSSTESLSHDLAERIGDYSFPPKIVCNLPAKHFLYQFTNCSPLSPKSFMVETDVINTIVYVP